MKLKHYLCLLLTGLILVASAKSLKFKKAEKLYKSLAYKEAVPLYTELYNKNKEVEVCVNRLANCFRMLNDMGNAEKWYEVLTSKYNFSAEDAYHYAMALKINGKLEDADKWMLKYKESNKNDSRIAEYEKEKSMLEKLLKMKDQYEVSNMSFNTDGIEFSPSYYNEDELLFVASRNKELIIKHQFSWNQTPFLDVYKVSIKGNTEPVPLKGNINSKYHDGPVCVTSDLKGLYFTRNNYFNRKKGTSSDGIIKLKLYSSTINEKGEWDNITEMSFDNKEYSVGHPTINNEGNKLFFTSDMPGSIGGTDIWYAEKNSDGSWGAPKNMGPIINTEGNEMFPFISAHGDFFFASNGHFGLGGLDIFYAKNKNNEYNKIMNLGAGINSPKDDFGLIISPDSKTGYLSSNREGGKGDDDIYAINFLKPLYIPNIFKGKIIDEETKKPIANISVIIKSNGKNIEVKTNDNGEFDMETETLKNVEVDISDKDYFPETKTGISHNFTDEDKTYSMTISLVKKGGYILTGVIKDKKAATPIEGVKISFESGGEAPKSISTSNEGKLNYSLANNLKPGDKISYKIKFEKEGYITKEVEFGKNLEKPGVINLNQALNNLDMEKLAVGVDLAQVIDIKPIYFDLGKFNIRKDAAVELDKIVKTMNEHPNMIIELGSHTDCKGLAKANEQLSDKRAKASAAYIVSKGIGSDRIKGKGYGESKLLNGCACEGAVKSTCKEEEHQANRRTEFIIVRLD